MAPDWNMLVCLCIHKHAVYQYARGYRCIPQMSKSSLSFLWILFLQFMSMSFECEIHARHTRCVGVLAFKEVTRHCQAYRPGRRS